MTTCYIKLPLFYETIIIVIIIVIIVVWLWLTCKYWFVESFETQIKKDHELFKCNVINLKNRPEKMESMLKNFTEFPLHRFDAINGSHIGHFENFLSNQGLRDYQQVLNDGHRTKHHQLTSGAVGCYLSHLDLAKQLLNDHDNKIYLILEDDVTTIKAFPDGIRSLGDAIGVILHNEPMDWDIIALGYHYLNPKPDKIATIQTPYLYLPQPHHYSYYKDTFTFKKVNGMWGMFGYLLSKSGAQKMVNAYMKDKIDAQIDIYLSWLSQKGLLNMYAIENSIIIPNTKYTVSDIQAKIINNDNKTYTHTYNGLYI